MHQPNDTRFAPPSLNLFQIGLEEIEVYMDVSIEQLYLFSHWSSSIG
jgi:hypothetical protein